MKTDALGLALMLEDYTRNVEDEIKSLLYCVRDNIEFYESELKAAQAENRRLMKKLGEL